MNMFKIAIPSYKHRKTTLIDRLNEAEIDPKDVCIFIYESDKENYNLEDYKDSTVYLVPEDYKSGQRMRMFIQQTMGNQIYWCIDDDIGNKGTKYVAGEKRNQVEVSLGELLKIGESYIPKNEKWGCLAPTLSETVIYFSEPNKPVSGNGTCCACILINNPDLLSQNVLYTGDKNVTEDLEFSLNCSLAGYPQHIIKHLKIKDIEKMGNSGWYNYADLQMNNYVKFGNYIKIKPNKETKLNCVIDWHHKGPQVWNEEIKEACESKDIDAVLKAIENSNIKKTLKSGLILKKNK